MRRIIRSIYFADYICILMKFISAFILLVALIIQTGSRFVVVLEYELNRNYIASNLCENRSRPAMGCHGKCYLKKQLAKADKSEGLPNSNAGKIKEQQLFFYTAKKIRHFLIADPVQNNYPPSGDDRLPLDVPGSIFHPPQA